MKLRYIIILIFLTVCFFDYYEWYEIRSMLVDLFQILLIIILCVISIIVVLGFLVLTFYRREVRENNYKLFCMMNCINAFIVGSSIVYLIVLLNFVPRNFKNYEDIYLYTLKDILSFEIPFIVKSPRDLLSSNGLYYSEDIKSYDEYKKFKLKNTATYVNVDENPSDEFHMYQGTNFYAKSEDEIEAEMEEERYSDAMMSDGGNDYSDPGVHEVSGYSRSDGTYVESYERTNPDGIEENNFSYDGR